MVQGHDVQETAPHPAVVLLQFRQAGAVDVLRVRLAQRL